MSLHWHVPQGFPCRRPRVGKTIEAERISLEAERLETGDREIIKSFWIAMVNGIKVRAVVCPHKLVQGLSQSHGREAAPYRAFRQDGNFGDCPLPHQSMVRIELAPVSARPHRTRLCFSEERSSTVPGRATFLRKRAVPTGMRNVYIFRAERL